MLVINAMLSVAIALTSLSQGSSSYEWNKKSTLTIDHQVEFPGIVLEPGVYTVKLAETGEKRSTVQILNQDENQVLATLVAVPDNQLPPENNGEFIFHKVTSGPQPVRSWFFSGDLVGLEFVYPEVRAKEIAKESADHVMASNSKSGAIVAVTPNGKEVVIDEAPSIQSARRKPQ